MARAPPFAGSRANDGDGRRAAAAREARRSTAAAAAGRGRRLAQRDGRGFARRAEARDAGDRACAVPAASGHAKASARTRTSRRWWRSPRPISSPRRAGTATVADPAAEWHQVYEEFLRTKRECNEPTDGLTFEKFQQTLKKNRDALMQRHGCKRVKFSVYVKEGRASLKATPVRD